MSEETGQDPVREKAPDSGKWLRRLARGFGFGRQAPLPPPVLRFPVLRFDGVVVSDRHRGLFNAASARQRRLIDSLGPAPSEQVTITCNWLVHDGDTDDMESKAIHRKWGATEEDKCYYDSVNAAGARGVDNTMLRGNHDEPFRRIEGQTRHGIHYGEKKEFTTARGDNVVILHGDQFDTALPHLSDLAQLLSRGTAAVLKRADGAGRTGRALKAAAVSVAGGIGRRLVVAVHDAHTALAAASTYASRALHWATGLDFNPYGALQTAVNRATGFLQDFEDRAVNYALDNGKDVIVTGHTHAAYIKVIKKGALINAFNTQGKRIKRVAARDVTFINTGDGVTSHTFLGITAAGDFRLVSWREFSRVAGPEPKGLKEENKKLHREKTEAQIADVHEACFGVRANEPVPAAVFRPRRQAR